MPTAQPFPSTVEALLSDGTTATIRPLGPADREAAYDLHAVRMSDESRRQRFFGASRLAPQLAADRLCAPPRPGFLALGAWVDRELVGAADYETVCGRPDTAEIALAVADEWQRHGVATLLLEHLLHAAREQGVLAIEADTLAGNRAVHKVFTDLGLRVHRHLDHGEIRVQVPLDERDEHYRSAVEERGRSADVASLVPLLRPRSVAVVGASRRPGSVGRTVLEKIRQGGFKGELWAVNPYAERIGGEPAYPGLSELPGTPDLAVLAVPPGVVSSAAEECGQAGVRALVVLTSGLSGADAQQLLHSCRRHSMRLVGPNCLGIAVTNDAVRLDAEFGAAWPLPGTAGVAVQSGGVGIALLERLTWLGIGVSDFVSLGDKYDVSGNDLLQWWESDGRTNLALLHLESFGNPRAFSRTARRVTRKIPVLTVDAGRSAAGRRGAASHTAAAATSTVTRQALFSQAGITATRGIGELVETAALLHAQPLPTARSSVAVVSNAGGVGILAADACVDYGLTLPELPAHLAIDLVDLLPPGATAANPVDTTAAVGPDELRSCLDLLERSRSVEALLVCLVPTALTTSPEQDPLRALRDSPGRRRIPVVAVLLGQEVPVQYLDCADGARIPIYADPQSAARALAHARDRAAWLAEPPGAEPALTDCDPEAAKDLVARFLDAHPDGGWLNPSLTADLLGCYSLPLTTSVWAPDEHGMVLAARSMRQLGHEGKIALKAYWPGQVHKSDVGAVYLGPGDDASVRSTFRDFENRFGERLAGVVVQPMAAPGTELFAGIVQDQVFGPLTVFGLGGTATDLLDDRTARLTPLTENDLHTMTTELRCAPLLFGYHGHPAVDLTAVQDLLARLSRLADDVPQLAEADLNPVIATPDALLCVDARVRLEPRHPFDPYLRRLRRPVED
ncbi:GNAT family N-acetyltransferase [Streptomyces tateyamensis]|uniref:GNAT family N-acetyltransferase n=1 Tax=Streptomyces tateyamensis TaxID=565073 RepID=A0A2V4NFP3_9ACTN|nr:bifunctional GNAT family N-acetyltransferase/acetate--CoA ligase family protein [Streptomyces tateyamensis]PYC82645.1 GNAT family N-acetyltransferase [Streptomyces tateyamensis]